MSAATPEQEAVLVAAHLLLERGQAAAPGVITLRTRTPLTTAEVMLAAGALARDGYLEVVDDGGATVYGLTRAGVEYGEAIAARGT